MRAVARSTKLVTRLETPLPPTLIERAELERMLLTLVAHATETRRSERVVVATTACTVKIPDPLGAPPGDWVVIEVQDDGEAMPVEVRDGALRPTFTVQPAAASSCLGLPSIARITRSLGGHFAIDDRPRGTTVALWLPRAD